MLHIYEPGPEPTLAMTSRPRAYAAVIKRSVETFTTGMEDDLKKQTDALARTPLNNDFLRTRDSNDGYNNSLLIIIYDHRSSTTYLFWENRFLPNPVYLMVCFTRLWYFTLGNP